MKKQAVVVIHGMGEQVPMETLTSFVDAVWTTDDSLVSRGKPDPNTGGPRHFNASWCKPDPDDDSFEQRRITTEADLHGRRTDFFEFYWADLMVGNTWAQVRAWVLYLIWRDPVLRVPAPVRLAWFVLVLVTVAWIGIAAHVIWAVATGAALHPALSAGVAVGTLAFGWVANVWLVPRFGDVARYVRALPPNVSARRAIRARGVRLFERLIHSGEYDRIIVAAHSLGAIVAYDVLAHTFARLSDRVDMACLREGPEQPARLALEAALRSVLPFDAPGAPPELDIDAFQRMQDAARGELIAQGTPWIVSDFVTIGSPLTHAEFLLAHDLEELRSEQTRRLLPTCPPQVEHDRKTGLAHFTYRRGVVEGICAQDDGPRVPHHAALFAYTRWTNLYSPHRAIVFGDIISGPVADAFGLAIGRRIVRGIRDIAVLPALDARGAPAAPGRRPLLTHSDYWSFAAMRRANSSTGQPHHRLADAPHHIRALRHAIGLARGASDDSSD